MTEKWEHDLEIGDLNWMEIGWGKFFKHIVLRLKNGENSEIGKH